MFNLSALSLSLLAVVQITVATFSDGQIDDVVESSADKGIYTTHSESIRPIHVPVYEKYPVNVPHPVPIAVPHYVKVSIPQPYPVYHHVKHKVEVPVYRLIPEIVEKPVPYTVERPYPVEVERPFPVQVVKKLEIPVPKPYPVHVIYYKHISEDDPPPPQVKFPSQSLTNSFYQFKDESPKKNKFANFSGKYKTIKSPESPGKYFERPSSHSGKVNSLQYSIEHPTLKENPGTTFENLHSSQFNNLNFADEHSVDPGFPDKFIRLQYGSEITPSSKGQYSSLQLSRDISPNLHHDYQYSGY